MTTVEQPRHAPGVPTGGEWAAATRNASEISLAHLSDAEYNAEASFKFPPRPRSAAQHIAFWESVPIPDEALDIFSKGHWWTREDYFKATRKELLQRYTEEFPHPNSPKYRGKKPRNMAQADKEWGDASVVYANNVIDPIKENWPTIPGYELRTVLRAHRIAHDAIYGMEGVTQSELDAILDHRLPWPDQPDGVTVRSIYETFRTAEADKWSHGTLPTDDGTPQWPGYAQDAPV